MAPRPNTATVAPGSTLAVLSTAPMPVVTPQPSRADLVQRRLFGDFCQRHFRQHGVLGKRRGAHVVVQCFTVERKTARCRPASGPGPVSPARRRTGWSCRRGRICTCHTRPCTAGITWSPGCRLVTPGPTASTMPRTFVTEHGREQALRVLAGQGVGIGMADTGGDDAHQHFTGLLGPAHQSRSGSGACRLPGQSRRVTSWNNSLRQQPAGPAMMDSQARQCRLLPLAG